MPWFGVMVCCSVRDSECRRWTMSVAKDLQQAPPPWGFITLSHRVAEARGPGNQPSWSYDSGQDRSQGLRAGVAGPGAALHCSCSDETEFQPSNFFMSVSGWTHVATQDDARCPHTPRHQVANPDTTVVAFLALPLPASCMQTAYPPGAFGASKASG